LPVDDIEVALHHEAPLAEIDAGLVGIGGAEGLVLHGGEHRRPPAGRPDLVVVRKDDTRRPSVGKIHRSTSAATEM
jgi:hypothetical protein